MRSFSRTCTPNVRRASPTSTRCSNPPIRASERHGRVRILIFNWKDRRHPLAGGAEVFTEEVAHALVVRGHDVTLFVAAVTGRPEQETVGGVGVIRRGSRLGVYRAARRFWAREGRGAFDVVVDEINTRPFMTPRWVRGTPVVALIHQLAREIWFYETPLPLAVAGRFALEPWWLRAYRDVPALTVSASSADSLRRHHGWRDVTVVPEGWTPHPLPAVPKEAEPTVVFLGRLVAMKRPQEAIAAFQVLRQRLPSARLWVIGDGPLRLEAQAGVTFLGRRARLSSVRPRHMPAPCATAYTGASKASVATSVARRRCETATAAAPALMAASAYAPTTGFRIAAAASIALAG